MSEPTSENSLQQAHSQAHTNYFKIWVILVILLVVSVVGAEVDIKAVTLIAAFGIAVVKAFMVAAYFMHLNIEKKYIWYILLSCLALMVLFFFALAPDIMNHSGTNWRVI